MLKFEGNWCVFVVEILLWSSHPFFAEKGLKQRFRSEKSRCTYSSSKILSANFLPALYPLYDFTVTNNVAGLLGEECHSILRSFYIYFVQRTLLFCAEALKFHWH
jgi:hypothetical protein